MAKLTLTIQTLDGVQFSLPLAGPVRRSLALLIDALVIAAVVTVIARTLQILAWISVDAVQAFAALCYFGISVGYGIFFEWRWYGQTLGKRVMNIRVLDAAGLKLTFPQIALRNLMRFVDCLPVAYLVGGATMLLSRRSQRLGDVVGGTIVMVQVKPSMPDLRRVIDERKYNSLLQIPHLAARLRQRTTPELARIAYEALLRRDELDPAARLEVFHELAAEFRALVEFPEEVTFALSDEAYVRDAFAVALAKGRMRSPVTVR